MIDLIIICQSNAMYGTFIVGDHKICDLITLCTFDIGAQVPDSSSSDSRELPSSSLWHDFIISFTLKHCLRVDP